MKLWYLSLLSLLLLTACSGESITSDFNIEPVESSTVVEESNPDDDFIVETGANLTAKEVQYNMSNNLDKSFFVKGKLSACDYYNYGFLNESKIFCGELTPVDGSDNWYLYFIRESEQELYNALLQGDLNVRVSAQVPSELYKSSQGNMALANAYQTYK